MIRYLIKNNFKLIFRNKLAVIVLLFGPALTIALLSNAMDSLMRSYEMPDEFKVGYRSSNSVVNENIDTIKNAGTDAGIILIEYPDGEPSELIKNNDLSAFVDINGSNYTIYKSGDHKTEGAATEYFIDKVMKSGIDAALDNMAPRTEMVSDIKETKLEYMPAVNATDYYGIIYIVYFSCCGMICATGMLSSEKKNGIERKYNVSSVSPFRLYLARVIPTLGVIIICTLIEAILTAVLFGIHWGSLLLSALIVIMMIVAFTSFGFMLYDISQNIAITVIALFAIIWILGYLGGSFETYMYSDFSQNIKNISAFYHANRALVELSCIGRSSYAASSLVFSGSITVICAIVTVTIEMVRRRGRN